MPEREGWATVYVDFFGVLTSSDIAQRIERAYAEQLSGRLTSWFSRVRRILRPTVRVRRLRYPASSRSVSTHRPSRHCSSGWPCPGVCTTRHGQRALVVFDEFQDVLATQDRADAIIRSEIQNHDAASYVFSGSHLGMMR